jgi:hypothetical protein
MVFATVELTEGSLAILKYEQRGAEKHPAQHRKAPDNGIRTSLTPVSKGAPIRQLNGKTEVPLGW